MDSATTPAERIATSVSTVGRVRPGRRPARNAATTVGTAHHRFITLRPAATAAAAVRRFPGSRARREAAFPGTLTSLIIVLSTHATVRTSGAVQHCRKFNPCLFPASTAVPGHPARVRLGRELVLLVLVAPDPCTPPSTGRPAHRGPDEGQGRGHGGDSA
jgi:hypothetical protein